MVLMSASTLLVFVLALIASVGVVFACWPYVTRSGFARRVNQALLKLGMTPASMDEIARRKLATECNAIHHVLRWRASPYRVAARFFTWYALEYPYHNEASIRAGSIVDSIEVMSQWAKAHPKLHDFLKSEAHSIVKALYFKAEEMDSNEKEKIVIQLKVLNLWARAWGETASQTK
jgi:hypothetical protein